MKDKYKCYVLANAVDESLPSNVVFKDKQLWTTWTENGCEGMWDTIGQNMAWLMKLHSKNGFHRIVPSSPIKTER